MSHRSRSRALRTTAALLALGAAMAVSGCASPEPDGKTLPPVIVDINEIDGTTVEVAEGNTIDLTGDDETYLDWTAEIENSDVVTFVPGKDDGSAQFNPGLDAVEVGETEVTLDNSSSGDSVTFTVEVTAPAK
ncbi:hypothetical protein [Microbacterium murale]|uniref:MSP domain-containing protein n=1 Tax=Microbacterium murale TaxID=1081040 RepID=A0ABU0P5G9_9MICO|nr:hypothetical protein [Microbacterium murale]MDQ0642563.1 hypothetical protein [Microbacterium murale]